MPTYHFDGVGNGLDGGKRALRKVSTSSTARRRASQLHKRRDLAKSIFKTRVGWKAAPSFLFALIHESRWLLPRHKTNKIAPIGTSTAQWGFCYTSAYVSNAGAHFCDHFWFILSGVRVFISWLEPGLLLRPVSCHCIQFSNST